jgi:phosphate uptake regulator
MNRHGAIMKGQGGQLEIRKVQKTGTSTMTVSLPKDWIEANGVKPGDQVSIEVQPDGSLTIEPKIQSVKKAFIATISVAMDEPTEHLVRKLIGAYLAGSTIIEVRSKGRMDLGVKRSIKDFTRLVSGPEIIEETANTVVLHNLSSPLQLPQRKCVRRMHLMVDTMHRDALTAYVNGDLSLAEDVIERDLEVDRLYWLTVKQHSMILDDRRLARDMGVSVQDSLSLLLVARILERVGDHAEKIARQAIAIAGDENPPVVKEMRDIGLRALEVLGRSVDSFTVQNEPLANATIDGGGKLVEEGAELQPRLQGYGGMGTMSRTAVMESIMRTTMYAMDIAEIAINDAMRNEMEKRIE